jgi:hypothetical protein
MFSGAYMPFRFAPSESFPRAPQRTPEISADCCQLRNLGPGLPSLQNELEESPQDSVHFEEIVEWGRYSSKKTIHQCKR